MSVSADPADRLQLVESKPSRGSWPLVLGPLLAATLIFGTLVWWIVVSRVSDEGVRLVYAIEPGGDPSTVKGAMRDAVVRRLESLRRGRVEVWIEGDAVVAKITGIAPALAPDYRKLLGKQGLLELCSVATGEVQEQFNRDGVVPAGYRAVENPAASRGPEVQAWNGPKLLIVHQPVVHGRQIVASEARQDLVIGGAQWVTTFELDADGARRFDEAAKILYEARPAGMVAILFDGTLRSAPVVRSPSFGGHGQISGAKSEQEAKELAAILRSGPLPARLGRMEDGVFIPGEPQEERLFGPEKKK